MTRTIYAGLLALCACGQPTAQTAEHDSTVQTGAATPAETSAVLPDYWHDYPNATPVEVPNLGVAGTDSRSGNARAWETDAAPAQVAAYYRAQFVAAGVPIRADTANADGGLIAVGRDGELGAMLTISRIGDKTRIALIRRAGG